MFGGARGDIRRTLRDIQHEEIMIIQRKADALATHEAVVMVDRDHPYGAIVTMPRQITPEQLGAPDMNVVREVYTSLGDEEFFPVQSFLEPEAQGWLDLAMIDPNTTIIPIGDATPLKVMEASTRLLNGSTKSGLGPETVTMIQARPRQAYAAWVAVKQQWEDAKKRLEEFRDVLRGGEG